MAKLTKLDIYRGIEAGISASVIKRRVYKEGKTADQAIAIGPNPKGRPRGNNPSDAALRERKRYQERKARG